MQKPTLLVLAAGMGSRYGSLKQMDQFGPSGESIIDYSVYDAARAGFKKIVFVIRRSLEEQFKEVFLGRFPNDLEVRYVFQELDSLPEGFSVPRERKKPWGTGHAVWVANSKIKEPFAVINADDFYGAESFNRIAQFLTNPPSNTYCLVGYRLSNTLSDHGYVSRGICEVEEGKLKDITERTKIGRNSAGTIVYQAENGEAIPLSGNETASMNLMGFTPQVFQTFESSFVEFMKNYGQQPKKEFYLPSVVNEIIKSGQAEVEVIPTPESWFGVTYPQDKETAQQALQRLVDEGVYPKNLWES